MKHHIDGQVGSVAQSGVKPIALMGLQYSQQLENAVKAMMTLANNEVLKSQFQTFSVLSIPAKTRK